MAMKTTKAKKSTSKGRHKDQETHQHKKTTKDTMNEDHHEACTPSQFAKTTTIVATTEQTIEIKLVSRSRRVPIEENNEGQEKKQ